MSAFIFLPNCVTSEPHFLLPRPTAAVTPSIIRATAAALLILR
jgi:hypothetical protein